MPSSRGTDGSLLSSLPWTLIALAVAAVPHLPYLPIWVTGAAIGCAWWRFAIERRRGALPSAWVRSGLAVTCAVGVLSVYETISGVGPGTALLAIMAALKLLETRKRRDQFVLLFIAIFLAMAALLREQYLWSLPYMLVSLIVTMSAWLRMSAPAAQPGRQSVTSAARLVGYAAPLAIAMWILFPRIATPFWAVPIDTSSGITGLSDEMNPGDISSLSQSDAVAFRVQFGDRIPRQRDLYWRALVLSRFDGRKWSRADENQDRAFRDRTEYLGQRIDYQVTMEPSRSHWLMSLDVVERWDQPRSFVTGSNSLHSIVPVDQRITYSATSYTDYRIDLARPEIRRRPWYFEFNEGRNPRTTQFARELRANSGSDEAYIEAILRKFNTEEYHYTLQPPPLGSDPVDRFLFDTQRGFCEHYASAFAVLMRAADIPARVVVGYQGGEINPMGGYMIVRQADAHAWTEVWLEGRGWLRVDPTAAVAPERIDAGRSAAMFDGAGAAWGLSAPSELLYQLSLTWDALNAGWNEFVLGYGPENQDRFMRWLGLSNPGWRNLLLTLVGTVAGLTLVVHLLLILRFRPPREDRARRLYERFVRKTGFTPSRGESPLHFAERVATGTPDARGVRSITSLYLDVRYGDGDDAAFDDLRRAVRRFRLRPA